MNAVVKTLVYAAVAAASVAVAAGVGYWTRHDRTRDREEVGGLLFPNPEDETESSLEDPTAARSLELSVFDDETGEHSTFAVENRDGLWRLTDFHGYPADAGAQLARTLGSVAYLEKSGFKTRRPSEHARLGVLDPEDRDTWVEQGHGDRITVKGDGDTELVNLIVGKRVEAAGDPNLHYVRIPGEDEVYVAAVDLDVSTSFADWINADLLALDPANDLLDLGDDAEPDPNETAEERQAREKRDAERASRLKAAEIVALAAKPVGAETPTVELRRGRTNDDWQLVGLDPATETLENSAVTSVVNTLDRLRILGVRPKPAALGPDLRLTEAVLDQLAGVPPQLRRQFVEGLQQEVLEDLFSRGFRIVLGPDDEPTFVSTNGELVASANNGVVYHLHFGNEFEGTERQLQFDAAANPGEGTGTDDTTRGRYLVVSIGFDEQSVPGRPVKPIPPEKPVTPEEQPEPAEEPESPEKADPATPEEPAQKVDDTKEDAAADSSAKAEADETEGDEAEGDSSAEESPQADATDESTEEDFAADDATEDAAVVEERADELAADTADVKSDEPADPKEAESLGDAKADPDVKPDAESQADPEPKPPTAEELQQRYEAALAVHAQRMQEYERQLPEWEKRAAIGRERAARLKERFGEWYYVIGDDEFEDLSLDRSEFVEAKKVEIPADHPLNPGVEVQPTPEDAEPENAKSEDSIPEKPVTDEPADKAPEVDAAKPAEEATPPE